MFDLLINSVQIPIFLVLTLFLKESIKHKWINFKNMTKKELIYEGKAKTLFFYDDNTIIQYFKDDATAFNKKKHEIINEKGIHFDSHLDIKNIKKFDHFS